MKMFVLGATGLIGGGVARRLLAAGHEVVGMARSEESAAKLKADGITPAFGDLETQLPGAQAAAAAADATVFAPQLLLEPEHQAVSALLEAIAGTNKTFIFTSGTGVLGQRTFGAWSEDTFTESDEFTPAKSLVRRVETENMVREAVLRGVRGMVVRPPLIWGPGDHGFISAIYQSVAKTGSACYVGEGLNCYSNVHIEDLADAYLRVLERGEPGALYHAVAGEIPNRWLAEAVGRDLGVPTRSLTPEEAFEVFGKFATLISIGASSRSRSPRTRRELGWEPKHLNMLDQIGEPRLRELAKPPVAA